MHRENKSSDKHRKKITHRHIVQSNIYCCQVVKDCQYTDKRNGMDWDEVLWVVSFWCFFYSAVGALYAFLHFHDALTLTMPLSGMTALYHAKIVARCSWYRSEYRCCMPAERIFIYAVQLSFLFNFTLLFTSRRNIILERVKKWS